MREASLTEGLVTARKRVIARAPDQTIEGPPYLWVHMLVDERSVQLLRDFTAWIDRLDEAAGEVVEIIVTGPPPLSGEVHKSLRTTQLVRRDARDGVQYQNEIAAFGGAADAELLLRLRKTRRVAQLLGVPTNQLPCLAFRVSPDWNVPLVFTLKPEWHENERARGTFFETLCSWLASDSSQTMLRGGVTVGQANRRVSACLRQLSRTIDKTISHIVRPKPTTIHRHSTQTPIRISDLQKKTVSRTACARLVVGGGPSQRSEPIGVRQLFMLLTFLTGSRKREFEDQTYDVVSEREFVGRLKEWHRKKIRPIKETDLEVPHRRLQREWSQFVKQMGSVFGLPGAFSTIRIGGQKYFAFNTKRFRLRTELSDSARLLARLAELGAERDR